MTTRTTSIFSGLIRDKATQIADDAERIAHTDPKLLFAVYDRLDRIEDRLRARLDEIDGEAAPPA